MNPMRITRYLLLASLALARTAHAEDPAGAAEPELAPEAPPADETPAEPVPSPATPTDVTVDADLGGPAKHGIVLGVRVGGLYPTTPLTLAPTFGGELGYFLPWRGHRLGFVLAVDYSSPDQSGTRMDPRVEGTTYTWHLTQQQLSFTPEILYRVFAAGPWVPYGGVGLRIYRLVSHDESAQGGPTIERTTETSMGAGVVIPAGLELHVGPGALTAEALFQFGPLDHQTTGETNTGGLSFTVGYRFAL